MGAMTDSAKDPLRTLRLCDSALKSQHSDGIPRRICRGRRTNVEKSGRYIGVDCYVSGKVVVECDRCLENLEMPVDLDILLSVKFGDAESSDETQEGEREVIFLPVDNAELDMKQVVYDYVCLSLPLQRIHEDGECNPDAIKYLEAQEVKEVSEETDKNPFAALKGLFG